MESPPPAPFLKLNMTSRGSQSIWTPAPTVPSPASAGQHYFSLDDILSSQQRVPCRVEQPLYRLGFLNTNSSEEHLLPGTKLEFPLWLARNLCSRRRHIVSVQLPKAYRESQRTILSADASVVDLHRLGPYYYSVGVQLLQLQSQEELELSRSLLETFLNRFQRIMDTALNAYQTDSSSLTSLMDEMEKHLFSLGQEALNQQISWEKGCGHRIAPSLMVEATRKRKRQPSESTEH